MAQKQKQKHTIFVLSGYHYHPDDGEHDIISAVFPTREAAAKETMKIFRDTFPDRAGEFTLDGCMWGNNFWDGDEEVKLNIDEFSI